jgi:hypothetical protein
VLDERHRRRRCLDLLYLTSEVPPSAHQDLPIWHSPLLALRDDTEPDDRRERLLAAGALWLQNHDLTEAALLVLVDEATGAWLAFQRPLRPGEESWTVGPVDGVPAPGSAGYTAVAPGVAAAEADSPIFHDSATEEL